MKEIFKNVRNKLTERYLDNNSFKNPKKFAAGYLIEKVGLKGTKIGDAEISKHHANFFINNGKASSSDILNLIKLAKEKVKKEFNINLELEIKLIGFKEKN